MGFFSFIVLLIILKIVCEIGENVEKIMDKNIKS